MAYAVSAQRTLSKQSGLLCHMTRLALYAPCRAWTPVSAQEKIPTSHKKDKIEKVAEAKRLKKTENGVEIMSSASELFSSLCIADASLHAEQVNPGVAVEGLLEVDSATALLPNVAVSTT